MVIVWFGLALQQPPTDCASHLPRENPDLRWVKSNV
jgi:hypothetical protein